MSTRLVEFLRRLRRSDESGQSLVIMSVAMMAILGVAALGIDVGTWDAQHHRDQVVADSAALAAANCLANPNTGTNTAATPQCTSSTDTSDAKQVAVSYAAQNGLTIATSNVTVSNGTVSVDAQSTSPSFFAKLFGIGSAHESATAAAGYTTAPAGASTLSWGCSQTQQNAGQCDAIYAADTTCGTSNGFTFSNAGSPIAGAVHSQGSINLSQGTFTFNGPITYGGSGCYTSSQDTVSGTQPSLGTSQPFPADYSQVFTSCGTGYAYACTGPGNTPSYCTYAAASYNVTTLSNGVYCAYGTGTPAKPSTWNGGITISNNTITATVTLIGGYINTSSLSFNGTPYLDDCLMYAIDTNAQAGTNNSNLAIDLTNGTYTTTGGIFAPNGTIYESSITINSGFLEALDVHMVGGSFATGEGPPVGTTATITTSTVGGGSDSLTG
jgi:hypothetical protein